MRWINILLDYIILGYGQAGKATGFEPVIPRFES